MEVLQSGLCNKENVLFNTPRPAFCGKVLLIDVTPRFLAGTAEQSYVLLSNEYVQRRGETSAVHVDAFHSIKISNEREAATNCRLLHFLVRERSLLYAGEC